MRETQERRLRTQISPNFAKFRQISLDQDQDQVSWNREKVFENSLEGEDVARFPFLTPQPLAQ